MKHWFATLTCVAAGAALTLIFGSLKMDIARGQAMAEASGRMALEMATRANAAESLLEKHLASARGRTVTVETPAPAPLARIIEVNRGPSAREAMERLKQLRIAPGPGQMRSIRLVVHELEALVAAGTNALPVIREFLALNQEVTYDTSASPGAKAKAPGFDPRVDTEFLVPPSLCLGLFDVVRQIGAAEAEKILADTLTTTGRGLEVLYLTRVLQQMSPNKYRELATGVAKELLANPVGKGTAPVDKQEQSYLFSVLTFFNDATYAGPAQAQLITAEGKVDKAAMKYLQGAMGEQTLTIAQQVWNDPRLQVAEKEPLARVALAYLGANPQAEPLFKTAINDPAMPPDYRRNLIEDLNQDGFLDRKNLTLKDVPLIESRLRFIQANAPNAIDKVNTAAFVEANKDLLGMLKRATTPTAAPKP